LERVPDEDRLWVRVAITCPPFGSTAKTASDGPAFLY
jgi:hypothetical protein